LIILIPIGGCANGEQKTITVFCGSASKPATEEAAQAFEEKTGIKVYLNFSGSGTMIAQMKISKSGDLYIPGSPDYMMMAERDGIVDPNSVKIISYLIPAILVQHGNPKNIQSLSDLAKPGIEVAIGTESCSKTASLVAFKSVDAILGWRVFSKWNPDTTDVIYLKPEQIPRLSYIPGAISKFTEDRESAQQFLDFLVSPKGQEIFSKWGYIATESKARKYAPNTEIGGEYKLPNTYKPLVK